MICTDFASMSLKTILSVSDSSWEGKSINNRRKWQAPATIVEAEALDNYYSEIESDSEDGSNEVSDQDLVLARVFPNSQETSNNATASTFARHEPTKTLKLTTDELDCDTILVNHELSDFENCPIMDI